jgi:hypothetical protein
MGHLLDHTTLKDWGFKPLEEKEFGDKKYFITYIIEDTSYTDMHHFNPIVLAVFPHKNLKFIWELCYFNLQTKKSTVFFRGKIANKTALREILKACIVFKPR